MTSLFVLLVGFFLSAPLLACSKFDTRIEAHKQTWLALISAKEMSPLSFFQAGAVKVAELKSFTKLAPLQPEQLRDLPELDTMSGKVHMFLSVRGTHGTSEEVEEAFLAQLEQDGKVCDFANEIDKLYSFKK